MVAVIFRKNGVVNQLESLFILQPLELLQGQQRDAQRILTIIFLSAMPAGEINCR